MEQGILELIPLWGFLVLCGGFSFLAYEIGFRLGGYFLKKGKKEPLDSMVTSMMGLLAFILAFTFGFAGNRFENRRMIVVEEANAIGTTYLRSKYLPQPYRDNIPPLLKDYLTLWLEGVKDKKVQEFLEKTDLIQKKLWNEVVLMVDEGISNEMYALYVESLSLLIDLNAKRALVLFRIQIPNILWYILFSLTIVSIGAMGYQSGFKKSRNMGIAFLVILSFSSVIYLIADLEDYREGFVTVSQRPLFDVQEMMQKYPTL